MAVDWPIVILSGMKIFQKFTESCYHIWYRSVSTSVILSNLQIDDHIIYLQDTDLDLCQIAFVDFPFIILFST